MENEILLQILAGVQKLSGQVETLSDQVQTLSDRVGSLENRIGALEDRVGLLENRVGAVEDQMQVLERRQAAMAEELTAFQEFTLEKFERLEQRLDGLEHQQKKFNLLVENEIRSSIQALADNQSFMAAQLSRIESQVTYHEEVIFKRVK